MPMNAIELLKSDHQTVRGLLAQLAETTSRAKKKRTRLLARIAEELRVHAKVEEEIFYPAFREAGNHDAEEMFFESREEHRAVEKLVLPDLEGTEPDGEAFSGRVKVLKELVEHHADEEEKEMFREARKTLSKEQLRDLGARMQERKLELEKQTKKRAS